VCVCADNELLRLQLLLSSFVFISCLHLKGFHLSTKREKERCNYSGRKLPLSAWIYESCFLLGREGGGGGVESNNSWEFASLGSLFG
jgi:hypothetical protein